MSTRKGNVLLWIVQVLLAALFLFAGGMKLVAPDEMLKSGGPIELPVAFLRFIGACELLGAFGLLLPGLLRIRRVLTPVAGVGLACIMTGATVITIEGGQAAAATLPLVVGQIGRAHV